MIHSRTHDMEDWLNTFTSVDRLYGKLMGESPAFLIY
jgi:hypothetical protein